MPSKIKCMVITPVGPRSKLESVRDTVESFLYYMPQEESAMLLLDDSESGVLEGNFSDHYNIRVLRAKDIFHTEKKGHSTRGVLFVKQIIALKIVTQEYDWDCLLRLDDDALITGWAPHRDALDIMVNKPEIGMLGAYCRRGDGSSKEAALAKQGRRIVRQIFSRTGMLHPRMTMLLLKLILKSKLKGYRLGHMCTGGAFFLSRAAYNTFISVLKNNVDFLQYSFLADDLLFALNVAAGGYKFEDFSDKEHVMAINWRGLPMPLEELVLRRKKVLHPVKDPEDPNHEKHVRAFFAQYRIP
ncbi:MAG: hypothetical protein K9J79_10175 [Desulfobacteraceae bacterium]|nr:hypothetical protein [Desulfobacteraceae bacterium]